MENFIEIMKVILLVIGRMYIIASCIIGTYVIITTAILIKDYGFKNYKKSLIHATVSTGEKLDELNNEEEDQ